MEARERWWWWVVEDEGEAEEDVVVLMTTTHLPSASAAMTCGTWGCMHRDTTGAVHANAASGGWGRGVARWRTAAVEKQPMTVGETMRQQRPQGEEQTSLHLG